jgi:hypothetical protein
MADRESVWRAENGLLPAGRHSRANRKDPRFKEPSKNNAGQRGDRNSPQCTLAVQSMDFVFGFVFLFRHRHILQH